jgi:exocyst complex component 4
LRDFTGVSVNYNVSSQVRALLYDYLTDEDQGSVSGRNPISSINEILRDGKFARDKTKVGL